MAPLLLTNAKAIQSNKPFIDESQLHQMEAERMADSMMTSDHAEGITAMEKRPPKFSGK